MPVSKHFRPHVESNETLGLLANGSSGQWDVAIDETTSGVERWFVQIEGPIVSFYFEITSPKVLEKMIQFFEERIKKPHSKSTGKNCSLSIGEAEGSPVTLVKDDEYADRCFLLMGPENRPVVRFTLAGADLVSLTSALRQAKEDLEEP
jgi:hypothetical protein